ncbi:hypothetical protein CPB86DRAFT_524519 [Serendipita vermifera]|nr:hypothetical protein CPB86DRAFT_524519 [Serendipita vermifera]
MKLRHGSASSLGHDFGAVGLEESLSVLDSLQRNKSGLQIILHLLTEWNNIEIQLICARRNLLADVTLLWTKIANVDGGLETLWRQLVMNLRDELTTRWNKALSLKEEYEKVLNQSLSHLQAESLPDERPLSAALKEHQKAQAAAQKLYQKGQVRDRFVDSRNSDRSNRSGTLLSKNSWISSPDTQSEKLEKADDRMPTSTL